MTIILIHTTIFWVLLLDALFANGIAWFGQKWYMKHFQIMSRFVPLTRVWALWYLILVLWAGCIMRSVGWL